MEEMVIGVFFGVVLTVLLILMLKDWDGDTPGRQNFRDRKKRGQ